MVEPFTIATFILSALASKAVGDAGTALARQAWNLIRPGEQFPKDNPPDAETLKREIEAAERDPDKRAELDRIRQEIEVQINQTISGSGHRIAGHTYIEHYHVTAGLAEASAANAPVPAIGTATNLPPMRTDYVERSGVLERIGAALAGGSGAAAITTTGAITGLGGIGKTMTALAYAYRHLADYDLIWWLRAEACETLEADYLELAAPLAIPSAGLQPREVMARIRWALGQRDRWLLIFDNVEDSNSIQRFRPGTGGHVLVTTRQNQWDGLGTAVPLGVMSEDEAERLLLAPNEDNAPREVRAAATALAQELGYLPLALAQAHAYCRRRRLSLEKYAKLLRADPKVMLADKKSLPPGYPMPVALTWALSLGKAEENVSGAKLLLEIISCLAPEEIPYDLFVASRECLPSPLDNCDVLYEAFSELAAFSLVNLQSGANGDAVSLDAHRLVQTVTLAGLSEEAKRDRVYCALVLLSNAMPRGAYIYNNWSVVGQLLPHLECATALAKEKQGNQEILGSLLNSAGLYYESRGSYDLAEPHLRHALAITEASFGANHPDTGTCLNNLAGLLRSRSRLDEAEPLYRRALEIAERTLGEDHPDTGTYLNNLAELLEATGRYGEAELLFRRALEIAERTLGEDHPDTGARLNNLAGLLRATGRHGEAEPLYRRALKITETSFGEDHPDTGTRLNNLALLLDHMARHDEAEPLFRRALEIVEKSLGADHPKTAISLNNLAALLHVTGRYGEAEPLYRRALKIAEMSRGANHPETGACLSNLAGLLKIRGRHGEAEPLLRRALEIAERSLGADHPETGKSLNNLAVLLEAMGRLSEAEPVSRRALAIVEAALPDDHPSTAIFAENLATILDKIGKSEEAAAFRAQAAEIWRKRGED